MIAHHIDLSPASLLFLAVKRRRKVRYWFNEYGQTVGLWRSRGGKTYAVSFDRFGKTLIYRTECTIRIRYWHSLLALTK